MFVLGNQVALHAGVYEKLLSMEAGEKDNEIARDLNRTYPTHVFYQQSEGAGQKSLYHVLKTYSVYDKKVRVAADMISTGSQAVYYFHCSGCVSCVASAWHV